jgi:hypothetical protein
LTGGKIKKLDFSLDIDSDGRYSVSSVVANGKRIGFEQWGFVTRIIRAFTSNLAAGV